LFVSGARNARFRTTSPEGKTSGAKRDTRNDYGAAGWL